MSMHTIKPKPLYIFDLDGTLANIKHRLPILNDESLSVSDRWQMFYAQCPHDLPNEAIIRTLHFLVFRGCDVWIWSARSDEVLAETKEWLSTYCNFFENLLADSTMRLYLRKSNDFRPDSELKQGWLHEMSKTDRSRLLAVFEDRSEVVDMFRRNGVWCFQVDDGDFEGLKEPSEAEILDQHQQRDFELSWGSPVIYIAKSPFSSIGKPATTEYQRAVAESIVKNESLSGISHVNQVRFLSPRSNTTGFVA